MFFHLVEGLLVVFLGDDVVQLAAGTFTCLEVEVLCLEVVGLRREVLVAYVLFELPTLVREIEVLLNLGAYFFATLV